MGSKEIEKNFEEKSVPKKFFKFNFSLFLLTNILLLIFSLFRGLSGVLTFFSFLILNLLFLLIYIYLQRNFERFPFGIFFLVFSVVNYFLLMITLHFLKDAVAMGYDLKKVSFSLIPFFINKVLGIQNILLFSAGLFLMVLVSLYLALGDHIFDIYRIKSSKLFLVVVILLLSLFLLCLLFNGSFYNPYVEIISPKPIQSALSLKDVPQEGASLIYNNNFDSFDFSNKRYKYVFVFVMEQTSLNDFYEEKQTIPPEEDFFERVKNKTHFFNNYYTSNQDSRTAIWEMLNSFFIPIECYVEPWQNYYGYILETDNLIRLIKKNGVQPYAVSSVGGGSLIMGVYPFNKFLNLPDYSESKKEFLCSTWLSYQDGCEDLAIFDEFTNHVLENKDQSLFYIQELIFGHGEKYMSLIGKERVHYYSIYFNQFYDFLESENLLNDSLIVVLSDHGPKGGGPRFSSDFNIPLMFISQNFERQEISTFYSHYSFKDIFLSYYLGGSMPPEEKLIYLIGQTARGRVGYVDSQEEYSNPRIYSWKQFPNRRRISFWSKYY